MSNNKEKKSPLPGNLKASLPRPAGKKEKQERTSSTVATTSGLPTSILTPLRGLHKNQPHPNNNHQRVAAAVPLAATSRGLGKNTAPNKSDTSGASRNQPSSHATVVPTNTGRRGLRKNNDNNNIIHVPNTEVAGSWVRSGGVSNETTMTTSSTPATHVGTTAGAFSVTIGATSGPEEESHTNDLLVAHDSQQRTFNTDDIDGGNGDRDDDAGRATGAECPENPEQQQRQNSNHGLVEAMPVQDAEAPKVVAVPDTEHKNSSTAQNKTRQYIWAGLALMLLVTGGIIIGSICGSGLCHQGNGDDDPIQSKLSERDTAQRPGMVSILEDSLGTGYFEGLETSEHGNDGSIRDFLLETRQRALDWIVNQDPLPLEYESNNLLQRFILVQFYFQTTRHRPWNDCNPPSNSGSSSSFCHFLSVHGKALGNPWLSSSHECHWAGILCQNNKIAELHLWRLGLNGPLPWEIGKLLSLERLILYGNKLTGVLPTKLLSGENSIALKYLDLSSNEFSGTIPSEWFATQQGAGGLLGLSLRSNRLTGRVPSALGLVPLRLLELSNNTLTGTLPVELFHSTPLEWLYLDGNHITGTLPTEVGLLTELERLFLSSNPIAGSIPSETGMAESLEKFNVSCTNMQGAVPEDFYLGLTSLADVALNDCDFTDTISSSLGLLTNLSWLNIANNNFRGTIPGEIEALTRLDALVLNGNDFTGAVPESICQNHYTNHGSGESRFELVADCLADPESGVAEIDCAESCCTRCCDEAGFCRDH